jgi:hypothetical protein
MQRALRRSWRHLAKERIENTTPDIPLGKRFWRVSEKEQNALESLFASEAMRRLGTSLRSREAWISSMPLIGSRVAVHCGDFAAPCCSTLARTLPKK